MLEQRNHHARSRVPREHCKANQKLLPWKAGVGGGGWKPNHRESELRPHFTSSALRPSVVALSAGVAGDRGFVREAKSTLKGSTLGPPSILI